MSKTAPSNNFKSWTHPVVRRALIVFVKYRFSSLKFFYDCPPSWSRCVITPTDPEGFSERYRCELKSCPLFIIQSREFIAALAPYVARYIFNSFQLALFFIKTGEIVRTTHAVVRYRLI